MPFDENMLVLEEFSRKTSDSHPKLVVYCLISDEFPTNLLTGIVELINLSRTSSQSVEKHSRSYNERRLLLK